MEIKIIEGIICSDIILERNISSFNVENNNSLYSISATGRLAQLCNKYLDQGSHVLISGIEKDNNIEARTVKFLPHKY